MTSHNAYRDLPSVDRVLADDRVRVLSAEYSGDTIVSLVREELAVARDAVSNGNAAAAFETIVAGVETRARAALVTSLGPVINATGVIIHTNLGRAPLSDEALHAMDRAARGYSNLEYDLEAGERGSRHVHLEDQLRSLTGAEAALVVNNNAGAVLLSLSALATGREVIISRSQLVEIGGGFRIPDVMAESGAYLMEVGTTNRTYLRDYEAAITDLSAALMRVHTSNFKVVGFTATVPLAELTKLAKERNLLVIDDLGSGCFLDTTRFGLQPEPTPRESMVAHADVALFSGDKLLGGPQAGIIIGSREAIDRMRHHPLARALRIDKSSIAALAATLDHYLKDEALEKIPVWRMIATPVEAIGRRARRWVRATGHGARVIDGRSLIGGGSLPEEGIATKLLAIPPQPDRSAERMARRLRDYDPPVIARIDHGSLLLDPRTVQRRDDRIVAAALATALADA